MINFPVYTLCEILPSGFFFVLFLLRLQYLYSCLLFVNLCLFSCASNTFHSCIRGLFSCVSNTFIRVCFLASQTLFIRAFVSIFLHVQQPFIRGYFPACPTPFIRVVSCVSNAFHSCLSFVHSWQFSCVSNTFIRVCFLASQTLFIRAFVSIFLHVQQPFIRGYFPACPTPFIRVVSCVSNAFHSCLSFVHSWQFSCVSNTFIRVCFLASQTLFIRAFVSIFLHVQQPFIRGYFPACPTPFIRVVSCVSNAFHSCLSFVHSWPFLCVSNTFHSCHLFVNSWQSLACPTPFIRGIPNTPYKLNKNSMLSILSAKVFSCGV